MIEIDNSENYKKRHFAFLRRHFNGDYSLARSYWINSFVPSILFTLFGFSLISWLGEEVPARYGSSMILIFALCSLLLWFWGVRGTWASSNKHVTRGGKKVWVNVVKIVIILGAVRTVGELVTMAPNLAEHFRVALGQQFGADVVFQVRADGKSLLLNGGFNDGVAEQLEKVLNQSPSVKTIVLSSQGGWVIQGKRVANVIAERKLNTYVEQECTSACTIAFLAGVERTAEPNARIGFHSFRSIGANALTVSIEKKQAIKTYSGNLSSAFIDKIISTPHDTVWYPTHNELLKEGILTKRTMGGEMASLATTIDTREKLIIEIKKRRAFQVLANKYPEDFDRLIETLWKSIQDKRSDGEILGIARSQISLIANKLLPIVSDQTLIDFNILIADQINALSKRNAEACIELMFPTGKSLNVAGLLPPELIEHEFELITLVIETSDPRNAKPLNEEALNRTIKSVMTQLKPEHMQYFVSPDKFTNSPQLKCDAIGAYMKQINMIPIEQRANTLRSIYASS